MHQERLRIVVVENDDDLAGVMADVLSALGHDVRIALSGQSALLLLTSVEVDLLFVDMDLGDMSGLEVLRAVRSSTERQQPYVVMLTGNGSPGYDVDAELAGSNRFAMKPLDSDAIAELVLVAQQHRQPR